MHDMIYAQKCLLPIPKKTVNCQAQFQNHFKELVAQPTEKTTNKHYFCRTPVLGLGLGVDFVFPPSQQLSK